MWPPKFSSRSGTTLRPGRGRSPAPTGRARDEAVAHGQHHRGAVVGFDSDETPRSHDALHPAGIVDHVLLRLLSSGCARCSRAPPASRCGRCSCGPGCRRRSRCRTPRPCFRSPPRAGFTAACPPRARALSSCSSMRMRPAAVDAGPRSENDVVDGDAWFSRPQILMIESSPFEGWRLRAV